MAYTPETDQIARLCSPSPKVAIRDKTNFEKYVLRDISLSECIERFKFENGINPAEDIDMTIFKDWLEELGWRRRTV